METTDGAEARASAARVLIFIFVAAVVRDSKGVRKNVFDVFDS
jgi:hypothetical protein